ncbi:hypothetical protein D3C87_339230 [compost metagenome]
MTKAVIYVRVSSKEQEEEGFSIPSQLRLLNEYARKGNFEIQRVFSEAESAKSSGRPEYTAMIAFLKSNPSVNTVLVEKTDRLYRNFEDSAQLNLKKMNLFVHFVKEGKILGPDSRSQEMFSHNVNLAVSALYVHNLAEEASKGMLEKARQGLWPSNAPIGYLNKLEDHTIYPDPKNAHLILRAFQLAATGQYTLKALTLQLRHDGLLSKRAGNTLSKSAISRILSNEIYYGDFTWKGIVYKGRHTPIIDKDLFARAQIGLRTNIKPKVTKRSFDYIGFMTCAHCGCAITAQEKRKKSGNTYIYYNCTNGKGLCDNVIYVREELIEKEISHALKQIRLPEDVIEWTRHALFENHQDEKLTRDRELKRLSSEYQTLQRKIDACYDDKLDGLISTERWQSKNDQWKSEQEQIEKKIAHLRQDNTAYLNEGIKLMELARKASELFKVLNQDEKRELLNQVLSNPQIKNGSLCYDFRFPNSWGSAI